MTRAVLLSGTGRFGESWHDFTATSPLIAKAVTQLGVSCEIRPTEAASFHDLAEADLLVVNAGRNPDAGPVAEDEWRPAYAELTAYLASNRPVVGLHAAAYGFADLPAWAERLGARWESGYSMHPPIDRAQVHLGPHSHPITAGLQDFDVWDERYSRLHVQKQRAQLAEHILDGVAHPLVLVGDRGNRSARTVYDALGHGVESYASEGRLRLLRREIAWALGFDSADIASL